MLATLNQVLKIAEEKQYAIAAFNTPTLESLQAAVDKAEEHQVPVIVAHAQLHEPVTPLSVIGPVMVALAKGVGSRMRPPGSRRDSGLFKAGSGAGLHLRNVRRLRPAL